MEPGLGGPAQSVFDPGEDIEAPQQIFLAEAAREFGEPLALLRPLQEVGPVGRHLNHRQIPQVVHEQGDEVLQIPAFAHEFLDDFEDRPAVSFYDRYAGAAADLHVRNPDHLTHILGADRSVHRRDHLVERR